MNSLWGEDFRKLGGKERKYLTLKDNRNKAST